MSEHPEHAGSEPRSGRDVPMWTKSLLAILAGNVIYYLAMPHLPSNWQHQLFRVDLGLGLDFAFCVGAFLLVRVILG
ncbi:MAG: hypothetical protein ACRD5L_04720 [Bryobacteraceae bacterium]